MRYHLAMCACVVGAGVQWTPGRSGYSNLALDDWVAVGDPDPDPDLNFSMAAHWARKHAPRGECPRPPARPHARSMHASGHGDFFRFLIFSAIRTMTIHTMAMTKTTMTKVADLAIWRRLLVVVWTVTVVAVTVVAMTAQGIHLPPSSLHPTSSPHLLVSHHPFPPHSLPYPSKPHLSSCRRGTRRTALR